VAAAAAEEVVRLARGIGPRAERFVEVRLDYLDDPGRAAGIMRGLKRAGVHTLATLRSTDAGGLYQGPVANQLRILQQAAEAGAEIVDLEIESAEKAGVDAVRALRGSAALLISFHDFHGTPERLDEVLAHLRRFKADYYKVVPTSLRHRDSAAILSLYRGGSAGKKPAGRAGKARLIAFGMGEVGAPTRVLSVARGAPFAYAALSADQPLAPGQFTGTELRECYRLDKISAKTQIYGVIGNPVAHSISPAVHNAAFAAAHRDAVYLAFRVEAIDDFRRALPAYRLAGFSVTLPHKEAIAQAADWIDAEARDVGAVNTVAVRGGQLRGYNTDMAGIVAPLARRLKLPGARILIAGTGGAARAAAFALARAHARVVIVGRRLEQATALAELVNGECIERNLLSGEQFDAIVHATPLGLAPDIESCFFSPGELNAPWLLETVYTPAETKLVRMARHRGIKVILGLEMFLEQAARQFELWTGKPAPRAVMERAARQALDIQTLNH
jgi:3-dehydroquinate dehydratase/shikimate dehydrogenase